MTGSKQQTAARRRSPRYDLVRDLHATACVPTEVPDSFDVSIVNLSTHGVSLTCETVFKAGQQMELRIASPSRGVQLNCLAIARWSRPEKVGLTAVGCEFDEPLADECFDRLSSAGYVNRRCDPRLPADLVGDARWELNDDKPVPIRITDFSRGGLRFYSPQAMPLGQRLLVELSIGQTVVARPIWAIEVPTGVFVGCSSANTKNFRILEEAVSSSGTVGPASPPETSPRPKMSGWVWAGAFLVIASGSAYIYDWYPPEHRRAIDQAIDRVADTVESLVSR